MSSKLHQEARKLLAGECTSLQWKQEGKSRDGMLSVICTQARAALLKHVMQGCWGSMWVEVRGGSGEEFQQLQNQGPVTVPSQSDPEHLNGHWETINATNPSRSPAGYNKKNCFNSLCSYAISWKASSLKIGEAQGKNKNSKILNNELWKFSK